MFIIENLDGFINMDRVEKVAIFDFDEYSTITASTTSGNSYEIYKTTDLDKAQQCYEFILQAIIKGYKSILIQNNADFVEVYKKDSAESETWHFI